MAFTPTDPNKAEVRITGTAPDYGLDFYIPRGERGEVGPTGPQGPAVPTNLSIGTIEVGPAAPGTVGPQGLTGPKGDTGGFTSGVDLGVSDLNLIVTPGLYRQSDSSKPTLALNYPKIGAGGVMQVMDRVTPGATASVFQLWFPTTGITNGVTVSYMRYSANNHTQWTPWRAYASSRVDQTAGRAIYQWDDLNSRDQLVYGDTGWRSLTPANGWTATSLYIRREGQTVTIAAANLNGTAATSDAVSEVLSTGFRCNVLPVSVRVPVMTGTTTDATRAGSVDISTHVLRVLGAAYTALGAGNIYISYPTIDAWPTTLPGTAVGTIPNT